MEAVSKEDEIIDIDTGEVIDSDAAELPVVARMMVEIRLDGSRTVARG